MIDAYAIQSLKDGRIYVGITTNIDKRISQHNSGLTFSTKGFRLWKLVYKEDFPDRITARQKEKYLKSGAGKEFLKLIAKANKTTN